MTVELNYREFGEGSPLVILHGLFGSSDNWASLAKRLSETHRVLTLDLRNHGNSPHVDSMRYEDMAEDVVNVLDRNQVEQATLLGHSVGGKTAMTLALLHPHRVSRLAVVDIAPVQYYHSHTETVEAMQTVDLTQVESREDVNRSLQEKIAEVGIRRFLLKNLKPSPDGFRWKVNLESIGQDMSELTRFPNFNEASFSKPTVFIGGSKSNYILRQHYREIFRWFPGANIVMLKDAGHWVHAEQPEAFLKTVRTFLKT